MYSRLTRALCLAASLSLLAAGISVTASAQTQNPLQALKDALKKAKEKPPQPQPGQPGTPAAGAHGPAAAPALADGDGGRIAAPAGTHIDEKVLAPLASGAKFFLSPHGVHVATVENSGSRVVVYHDGVEGPKFDEILQGAFPNSGTSQLVFSPDGNRYAYCGRSGDQFVVMVDGKEMERSPESNQGRFDEKSCALGFTSNNRHVFRLSFVSKGSMHGQSFYRFVFDGVSGPVSTEIKPVFSPDGNHYAYVATDPADEHRWGLVVDGKMAPYQGGSPQWTADSQHLYTTIRMPAPGGRGQVEQAMLDGKPFLRADLITLFVAPAGDLVVAEVLAGVAAQKPVRFLTVRAQKVAGSEQDGVHEGIDAVVFSPDGKHYAAKYRNVNNKQFIFVDGKRGMEYQSIDNIAFTADSSTVVYTAWANSKPFVVVGDHESDSCSNTNGAVTAPAGNRVGVLCGDYQGGPPTLFLDGKTIRAVAPTLADLRFTQDGAHYAYIAMQRDSSRRLVWDGVVQNASNFGNVSSGTREPYVLSTDGKHFAHFAQPPTSKGVDERGVFIDGKYVPVAIGITFFNLTFTPDGKHVLWAALVPGQEKFCVYVDGKPVCEVEAAIGRGAPDRWWEMSPDGTLLFLGQDDTGLKRFSVTPSPDTSLDRLLAGGH